MQFERLDKLTKKYSQVQTIQGPTRKEKVSENTLDIIDTNYISLFNEIDMSSLIISDHHLIEISTNCKANIQSDVRKKKAE